MSLPAIALHLEQISACAASIAELEFIGPQAFTNALLARPDITNLIRDVEVHEKSLFSLASPDVKSRRQTSNLSPSFSSQFSARKPRKATVVATVLGRDLHSKVNSAKDINNTGIDPRRSTVAPAREAFDVEVLLEGAEKLCSVYPSVNASGKIVALRERHQQLAASIAHYEARVQSNSVRLETMQQRRSETGSENGDDIDREMADEPAVIRPPVMSAEDVAREEREIRELEQRKKLLEERVTGMEKDLGVIRR